MATVAKALPDQLPSPQHRPGTEVIVYDGHCTFCTAQVRRLARWDRRGRLSFLSLHDPEVAARYPDLSHNALMQDMYLIDTRGRRYRGAEAFRYLSRRIKRLWLLAPLMHIPGSLPLWQRVYRMIARRRYKISGRSDCNDGACSVHFR